MTLFVFTHSNSQFFGQENLLQFSPHRVRFSAPSELQFGLTLDKTRSDAMNPFIDDHQDTCILEESAAAQNNGPIAYLSMDLKNQQ